MEEKKREKEPLAAEQTTSATGAGIEESFSRLDAITAEMERPEMTLEQSFQLFQEGMELVKRCGEQLADVEKQMIILEEGYPR